MTAREVAADPRVEALAPALLAWWERHGRRDLPWQREPTPYRVWVSEIMLQQTQVGTVVGYFDRFIAAFPDVVALADAPVDRVLHLWSGLGYYARARNLHRAAGVVRDLHGGRVPERFDALLALPGVGRSTAGAILALACGQRHPILDGNARRVLARCFGVEGWPGTAAVQQRLWALAEAATPAAAPARYTQAIMDLGATLCRGRRPACERCPLAVQCSARAAGRVAAIPAPRPRRERPRRACVPLVVVRDDGAVLLERRPAAGIWGGLWGFPELEAPEEAAGWCVARLGHAPASAAPAAPVMHGFTHFDLEMRPLVVRVAGCPGAAMEADRWLWYNVASPPRVGLAAPVARMIATLAVPGTR